MNAFSVSEATTQYGDQAWRLACSMVGSASDADDVIQQALIVVARKRPELEESARWPWFAAVIANVARKLRSQRARRFRREVPLATQVLEPEERGQPLDTMIHDELRGELRAAIETLPHNERDALLLVYLAELSYAEAAQALGTPIGTVASRVHRGTQRLRTKLRISPSIAPMLIASLPIAPPADGLSNASIRWSSECATRGAKLAVTTSIGFVAVLGLVLFTLFASLALDPSASKRVREHSLPVTSTMHLAQKTSRPVQASESTSDLKEAEHVDASRDGPIGLTEALVLYADVTIHVPAAWGEERARVEVFKLEPGTSTIDVERGGITRSNEWTWHAKHLVVGESYRISLRAIASSALLGEEIVTVSEGNNLVRLQAPPATMVKVVANEADFISCKAWSIAICEESEFVGFCGLDKSTLAEGVRDRATARLTTQSPAAHVALRAHGSFVVLAVPYRSPAQRAMAWAEGKRRGEAVLMRRVSHVVGADQIQEVRMPERQLQGAGVNGVVLNRSEGVVSFVARDGTNTAPGFGANKLATARVDSEGRFEIKAGRLLPGDYDIAWTTYALKDVPRSAMCGQATVTDGTMARVEVVAVEPRILKTTSLVVELAHPEYTSESSSYRIVLLNKNRSALSNVTRPLDFAPRLQIDRLPLGWTFMPVVRDDMGVVWTGASTTTKAEGNTLTINAAPRREMLTIALPGPVGVEWRVTCVPETGVLGRHASTLLRYILENGRGVVSGNGAKIGTMPRSIPQVLLAARVPTESDKDLPQVWISERFIAGSANDTIEIQELVQPATLAGNLPPSMYRHVSLEPASETYQELGIPTPRYPITVSKDGSFHLDNLWEGEYRLIASCSGSEKVLATLTLQSGETYEFLAERSRS